MQAKRNQSRAKENTMIEGRKVMKANRIKAMVVAITLILGSTAGVGAFFAKSNPTTPVEVGLDGYVYIAVPVDVAADFESDCPFGL